MCLYSITADYNGSLEEADVRISDDRYDFVECGAACQPTLDLSKFPIILPPRFYECQPSEQ